MYLPYPVIDSLANEIPALYLMNKELQDFLGMEGIRAICNILNLFNIVFNRPDVFHNLFMDSNLVIGGHRLEEFIYYGRHVTRSSHDGWNRNDVCGIEYNSLTIYYTNDQDYEKLLSYFADHEHNDIHKFRDGEYMSITKKDTVVLLIDMRLEVTDKERIYAMSLTKEGLRITHSIFLGDKVYDMSCVESIQIGIPIISGDGSFPAYLTRFLTPIYISSLETKLLVPMSTDRLPECKKGVLESNVAVHEMNITYDGAVSSKFYLGDM